MMTILQLNRVVYYWQFNKLRFAGIEVIELKDITDPRVTDLQTSSTIRSRSTHIGINLLQAV